MKNIVFILLSFCLAGEMEVDGGLSVTEGVTAASFVGNGGGLTGIGIKPERIYYKGGDGAFEDSYTVPNDKLWIVYVIVAEYGLNIHNNTGEWIGQVGGGSPDMSLTAALLPGQIISMSYYGPYAFNIYEYPISGSGTDQGMDYVEP